MVALTDEMLIEAYLYAKQLVLDPDFIQLLKAEIECRNLRDKV